MTLDCNGTTQTCPTTNGDYMCSLYVADVENCTAYFIPSDSTVSPDDVKFDVIFNSTDKDEM